MQIVFFGLLFSIVTLSLTNCTECSRTPDTNEQSSKTEAKVINKGIGPIKEITLDSKIDEALAAKGKEIFMMKCSACHKIDKRYIGPALGGLTKRRSPEWIMNMILNPSEMIKKDPVAKALYEEYLTPMAFQNVSQEEARAILEYFRQNT